MDGYETFLTSSFFLKKKYFILKKKEYNKMGIIMRFLKS